MGGCDPGFWRDLQVLVAQQQPFQLEHLVPLHWGATPAAAAGRGRPLCHLVFRPATSDRVDQHSVEVGMPGWVPAAAAGALQQRQLFLVSCQAAPQPACSSMDLGDSRYQGQLSSTGAQLERADSAWPAMSPPPAAAPPPAGEAAGEAAAGEASVVDRGVSGAGGQPASIQHLADSSMGRRPQGIEGLQLGHLVGRGSQGAVYQGWYQGQQVAVKISSGANRSPVQWQALQQEAAIGSRLNHPFLVHTLTHAVLAESVGPLGAGGVGEEQQEGEEAARGGGGYYFEAREGDLQQVATPGGPTPRSQAAGGGGWGSGGGDSTPRVLVPLEPAAGRGVHSSSGLAVQEEEGGAVAADDLLLLTQEVDDLYLGRRVGGEGGAAAAAAGGKQQGQVLVECWSAPQHCSFSGAGSTPRATSASTSRPLDHQPTSSSSSRGTRRAAQQTVPPVALQPAHRAAALSVVQQVASAAAATAAGLAASSSGSFMWPAAGGGAPSSRGSCEVSSGVQQGLGVGVGVAGPLPGEVAAPLSSYGSLPAVGPGGRGVGGGSQAASWSGQREPLAVWSVQEYCDKGSLQDALDLGWLRVSTSSKAPLRMDAVLVTAQEVAEGLAALHEAKVVHGDLTAYNVLLSSQGRWAARAGRGFYAKIADFGYARALSAAQLLRVNSYGSITHMAPEVLGQHLVSRAADVYSLGVLLWQLYTCSRPWAGLRSMEILEAVAVRRLALKLPPDTPPAYRDLTRWCMHPEASQRPPIQEVLRQLQAMREGRVAVEDF